ncbi:MAG: hypothetical protein ACRBDL_10550 [Alphaproteobacteria bacterium]
MTRTHGKYIPTLGISDTSKNITAFINHNYDEFWMIYRNLMPFIFGLQLLGALIDTFFFPNSTNFIFSETFHLMYLYFMGIWAINWHRLVINGIDYTPMRIFKPKRNELIFMLIAVLLTVGSMAIFSAGIFIPLQSGVKAVWPYVLIMFGSFCVSFFILYRFSFYFPARATNNPLTLMQAFHLSKGYIWNLFWSGFFASLKFMIILALLITFRTIMEALFGIDKESHSPLMTFMLDSPITLFFEPMYTVIGITALSNYYLYAMAHQKESYTNNDNPN